MALAAGTKLGPYEVSGKLGAGGMGEVYRARDTRLGREVAIKVLPAELAASPERRLRLEREARAISALNHPNICTLHDVGHQDGMDFLVMEYVEGETLAHRLERGPLPLEQVLKTGAQIADALDKAHRKGIIHRDLKPGNIMLAKSGAKLLDFGLAKPAVVAPLNVMLAETLQASAGTADKPMTAEGALLGTLQYMAPEQLEGKETDARTDLFAVGALLYEMATGRQAFAGQSQASIIVAILEHEPEPLTRVQPMSPPALQRAVERCLAKDPDERWQSAADLADELRWISTSGNTAASAVVPARPAPGMPAPTAAREKRAFRWSWIPWAVAALAVIAAVLVALLSNHTTSAARQQFAIPVPGEVVHLSLSPDGRYLAFVSPDENSGTNMLFVQEVGSREARLLAGTEGASYPFWSPDDSNVGFFAEGKLKKVPLAGGPPQALASVTSARGGAWNRKNVIVYAPDAGGPLWRINTDGGGNAPAGDHLVPGEASHRWPLFLPDGEHYLYWGGDFTDTPDTKAAIMLASLGSGTIREVVRARSPAGYSDGNLFYLDERGSLVYKALDTSTGKLTGEPHLVASVVGFAPSTYWAAFTVAENGTVVLNSTLGAALSALTWYDRSGKELGRIGDTTIQANPAISPDGSRVAVDVNDIKARNIDVWIQSLKTGTASRFTFHPAEECDGVWSRDGNTIAFRRGSSNLASSTSLQLKKANGLEPEKILKSMPTTDGSDILPNSWSVDDSHIVCTYQLVAGRSQLTLVSARDGQDTPLVATNASATNGQISPNGKLMAYASNESGDWEIYVTTFPTAIGKWQVSRGGGTEPRWNRHGNEIDYIGSKGVLTAVPVSEQGGFTTGVPQPLFRIHSRAPISSTDLFTYDVAPDGKRFLVNRYVKPDQIPPLTIVLNATSR